MAVPGTLRVGAISSSVRPRASFLTCLAALALLAPPGPGRAETAPPPPMNLTAEMRAADARLEARVSLSHRRILLGEALRDLTGQSGVAVSAGDKDGAADVPLGTYCKDMPLADAMNAIWAVVSYRKAEWEWRRNGSPGRYSYRLVQSAAALRLRERLRAWIWDAFDRDVLTLMDAVGGTEVQRLAAVQSVYGSYKPEQFSTSIRELMGYFSIYRDFLTPDVRAQVQRGVRLAVPVASLSPEQQAFLMDQDRRHNPGEVRNLGGASGVGQGAPWQLQFRVVLKHGVPQLVAWPGGGIMEEIAGGWFVYLRYRDYFKGLWMLDGDVEDASASSRAIDDLKPPPAPSAGNAQDYVARLDRQLELVAGGAGIPLFARLPVEKDDMRMKDPHGETVRVYWKQLWNQPALIKWRDGVLLFTKINWPLEDPPAPREFLAKLREHAKPGEYLPLDDITAAADLLSAKQLLQLKADFPVMGSVVGAQGILALMHRYPALARKAQSAQGVALTPDVVDALLQLPASPLTQALRSGEARYLQLKVKSSGEGETAKRGIEFHVRDANGKFLTGLGFMDVPQPGKAQAVGSAGR